MLANPKSFRARVSAALQRETEPLECLFPAPPCDADRCENAVKRRRDYGYAGKKKKKWDEYLPHRLNMEMRSIFKRVCYSKRH